MKREIVCSNCKGAIMPMHPNDVAIGIQRRIVRITQVKKPEDLSVTITEPSMVVTEFPRSLSCDQCGERIQDGIEAYAVTWWNTNREGEPGNWEQEYAQSGFRILK